MFDPDRYATLLLSDSAFLASLGAADDGMLRIRVWYALAEIAAAEYARGPGDDPIPDIDALVDAVLPVVLRRLARPGAQR